MKALLDTNFLMLPNQFGTDIFEYLKYHEACTLSSCVDELKRIVRQRGKDSASAKIALRLIEQNKIEIINSKERPVDKAILNYALREKCLVGTNDKALIKALKKNGIRIIRLKQKRYLVEE